MNYTGENYNRRALLATPTSQDYHLEGYFTSADIGDPHLLQLLEGTTRQPILHCHVPSLSTRNDPALFLPLSDFLLLSWMCTGNHTGLQRLRSFPPPSSLKSLD